MLATAAALAAGALGCTDSEVTQQDVRARMRAVPRVTVPERGPESSAPTGSTPAAVGRWQRFEQRPASESDVLDPAEIERLESLGYASGSEPVPARSGVTLHRAGAYDGLNLYVSGHGPEAVLMDMEGRVLHEWRMDLFEALPRYEAKRERWGSSAPNHWRRAHLASNGDLVAIYGGLGLVKLNAASQRLWGFDDHAHHDLAVLADGTIYTLVRGATSIPELSPQPVVMDYVVELSPDGVERRRVSLFECFRRSPYAPLIEWMAAKGDVLHTNTVDVLDGSQAHRSQVYAKGNLLLSFRELDTIAIVDLRAEKIVWARWGVWARQHQPVLLEDGTMLLFDNRGLGDRSRVIEFDPMTQAISWSYGRGAGERFDSEELGSVQRLPNGNTLVTESDNGRVFELTPAKEIVWEFVSPHRAGDDGEFVASIFELVRLAPDFPHEWADASTASTPGASIAGSRPR